MGEIRVQALALGRAVWTFVAERFIRVGKATDAQDRMIAKLESIEERLDCMERSAEGGAA